MQGTQIMTLMNLTGSFFKRNNPIDGAIAQVLMIINTVMTFESKKKLLTYKYHVAQRQFNRLEKLVTETSPYEVKGAKLYKHY